MTGGGIADRDRAGLRLWFRSARSASKVVDELLRKHGTRRGADVVIETNPDETNRLLRASADLIGVSVSDDDVIDALTASLTKRAADQIKKMPRSQRTMKALRGVVDRDVSGLLERQAFI